jgi:MFS transporter, FSR family, fosmidomycin resistance protein
MPAAPFAAPAFRQDATVMGLVGLAHSVSHFSQLLLAPLFPWLKDSFAVSYAQLGFLLTIFFVVSCVVQTLSGFWVDRYGPRPILFTGLALLGLAACGYSVSSSYTMLAVCSVVAGAGNGVFHPVDYTLLNRMIGKARLGHAYSVHGITGSLGWALAPLLLVPLTLAYSWRVALQAAAGLIGLVLLVLWINRDRLRLAPLPTRPARTPEGQPGSLATTAQSAQSAQATVESPFGFLTIPAVWLCFAFFFFNAGALSIVQSFAPEAARQLHAVPTQVAAMCLTVYMVCSAGGMVLGGFLASNPDRCERIVGAAFGVAAGLALVLGFADVAAWAVPVLFGAMGFSAGIAGPSRDLLVKRSAPDNATGRVYGVVYAGLDIGQAVVPMFIGVLMDKGAYSSVWLSLAALQGVLIVSAFNVRRARRTVLMPA